MNYRYDLADRDHFPFEIVPGAMVAVAFDDERLSVTQKTIQQTEDHNAITVEFSKIYSQADRTIIIFHDRGGTLKACAEHLAELGRNLLSGQKASF